MNDAEFVAALAENNREALLVERAARTTEIEALTERLAALEGQVKAIPFPTPVVVPPVEPGPRGEAGIGIRSASVRGGDLVLMMTDGTEHNAGRVEGKQGNPGRDGLTVKGDPGRDGKDGIASTDQIQAIASKAVDDRIEAVVEKRVADHVATLPIPKYRPDYKVGNAYQPGDLVSWAGQAWIATEETSAKPGDGKGWDLFVRRGRDLSK